MYKKHTLFGLLYWFFTPIRLYGDAGDSDSEGGSNEGTSGGTGIGGSHGGGFGGVGGGRDSGSTTNLNHASYVAKSLNLDAATTEGLFGLEKGTFTDNLGGNGISYSQATLDSITMDAIDKQFANMDMAYSQQLSFTTYGNYGYSIGTALNSGISTSMRNISVDAGFFNEMIGAVSQALGFGASDFHTDAQGNVLGPIDEAVADIAEMMGFEVNSAFASAIQSTTTALMGTMMGASAITQVAMSISAIADIGYAADAIDASTRDAMKAASAVIGFADTAIAGIDAINTIGDLQSAGFINSAQAAMGYAATALSLGLAFGQLNSTLAGMGVNTAGLTSSAAMAFGLSSYGASAAARFAITGNINDIFSAYSKWDFSVNVANSLSVNTVTSDPFGFMAGGSMYDVQSAGSEIHTVVQSRDPKISVDRTLDVMPTARFILGQEDSHYKDLSPIDTSVDSGEEGPNIAAAKATRFNRLIEEYNTYVATYETDVDLYNAKVASFNAGLSSITSQEDYDSAKASLDSTLANIEGRLSDTSGLIGNVTDEINNFV